MPRTLKMHSTRYTLTVQLITWEQYTEIEVASNLRKTEQP